MNLEILPILFIPIGILGIWLFILKKDVDKIMKRENSNYTGRVDNEIDVFRIIGTFRKSKTLSIKDKKLFSKILILIVISWLSSIIFIINFLYILLNN